MYRDIFRHCLDKNPGHVEAQPRKKNAASLITIFLARIVPSTPARDNGSSSFPFEATTSRDNDTQRSNTFLSRINRFLIPREFNTKRKKRKKRLSSFSNNDLEKLYDRIEYESSIFPRARNNKRKIRTSN